MKAFALSRQSNHIETISFHLSVESFVLPSACVRPDVRLIVAVCMSPLFYHLIRVMRRFLNRTANLQQDGMHFL